ncbi:hypothetical protein MIR68_008920 [Amoeboaphelidium protococcarum]|nr:hypothetical protein MIR68_008920 [Amoeboaphelidium protococcarum]KAI3648287.1 hypothetical protein MP228_006141 [Amoeboaphelidium protococcarum]
MSKGEKKAAYFTKVESLLKDYKSILVCNVDNVGSNQMHQIRKTLRGEAVVLMGKNTLVKKAIRNAGGDNPEYERLMPLIKGNVGFVFTNGDLKDVREKITSNKVRAPAKAGAVAPLDVFVPSGNTGIEPGKTSFFQALGVPTKIARGTIEITTDVHLVKAGEKVGPSEATLLNMLNISPFTYGLTVGAVYDEGTVFDPSLLDITNDVLLEKLMEGITQIASLSLALHYPTIASVPHLIVNNFKNLVGVSLATDYTIDQVKELKELLENPEALAAAQSAAAASSAAASSGGKSDEKKEEVKEEEEESDDDMGFGGLF